MEPFGLVPFSNQEPYFFEEEYLPETIPHNGRNHPLSGARTIQGYLPPWSGEEESDSDVEPVYKRQKVEPSPEDPEDPALPLDMWMIVCSMNLANLKPSDFWRQATPMFWVCKLLRTLARSFIPHRSLDELVAYRSPHNFFETLQRNKLDFLNIFGDALTFLKINWDLSQEEQKVLVALPNIRTLDMTFDASAADGFAYSTLIADGLFRTSLQSLTIDAWYNGSTAPQKITQRLSEVFKGENFPRLKEFKVLHINLLPQTFDAIKKLPQKIRKLWLEYSDLPTVILKNSLLDEAFFSLTHLHLRQNGLRPETSVELFTGLKMESLQCLDLSNTITQSASRLRNKIGAQGFKALATSTTLPNLRILSLKDNHIGKDSETIDSLKFEELKVLHSLEELDLSSNGLDKKFMRLFSGATFPHLRKLSLAYNGKIFKQECIEILQSMNLPKLETLDLRGQGLSKKQLKALTHSNNLKGCNILSYH